MDDPRQRKQHIPAFSSGVAVELSRQAALDANAGVDDFFIKIAR
jgi:hypothetical protein